MAEELQQKATEASRTFQKELEKEMAKEAQKGVNAAPKPDPTRKP